MKFCLLLFCVLLWTSVQARLQITFEDAECDYYNEEYISTCELMVDDDDEYYSKLMSKLEIIKQPPEDLKLVANLYDRRGGEYVDLGFRIDRNFCEVATNPNGPVQVFVKAFGIEIDNCPAKPGSYGNDRFVLNGDEFDIGRSLVYGDYQLSFSIENNNGLKLMHGNISMYLLP